MASNKFLSTFVSVDDRHSAVVESEEEKVQRWNLLVKKMIDAVVTHTTILMPDSDIRLEAKSIGELNTKVSAIESKN